MLAYVVTSATGWIMMVLLATTIIYPFLLRSGLLGPVQPFLKRMRIHYWMGYSIAGIVLVHLWIPMSAGLAGVVNSAGLDLATMAMLLIFGQVWLGRQLSQPTLSARRTLRRWHFWVMLGIAAFVLGHVALNSSTLQTLLHR
ncbi:hypothetical protein [Thermogemmatispora tikiterensis]|uniref:Ferric oxidoreductase domain-containing protein n=1 Tax=Thermogemmatispora tikiterensis TaxID=1825093 RepID=A0A328VBD6_9CHLR|nr:hypothetical protein [Thermogemmatispora tikiterensis]RAQ94099.1 hypothetical protein A4R35_01050 [Thermogemmatispora tikiterensis]